ncbi:MAG: hypothetical protein JSS64_10790 [Bacteroidetes bacterium]|nr:hypothetical protein [Bacteroidota bacterium]
MTNGFHFMYNYRVKYWGIVVSAFFLVLLVVLRISSFSLLGLSPESFLALSKFIFLAGLIIIAYSKEKHEDIRIEMYRRESLQFSFYLTQSLLLGGALTAELNQKNMIESGLLTLIATISISSYLATFNFFLLTGKQSYSKRLSYILGGVVALVCLTFMIWLD